MIGGSTVKNQSRFLPLRDEQLREENRYLKSELWSKMVGASIMAFGGFEGTPSGGCKDVDVGKEEGVNVDINVFSTLLI